MNILETKGHLKREPGEKANVYAPVRPQQIVVKSMVREFVEPRLRRLGAAAARPPAQGKRPHRSRTARAAEAARQGGEMTVYLVEPRRLRHPARGAGQRGRSPTVWAAAASHAAHVAPFLAGGDADRAAPARSRSRSAATICCGLIVQSAPSTSATAGRRRAGAPTGFDAATIVLAILAAGIVLRLAWLGHRPVRLRSIIANAVTRTRRSLSIG